MLKLKSSKKSYSINVPTSLKEITPEILNDLTADISIPKYHAIVAICFHVKLSTLALKTTSQNQSVQVISLLAKAHEEDLTNIGCGKVGDKVVTDRSTIERGIHMHIPLCLNNTAIYDYIHSDTVLANNLAKGGDGTTVPLVLDKVTDSKKDKANRIDSKSPEVIIVEFKIIPVSGIYASLPVDHKTIDPFKATDLLVN